MSSATEVINTTANGSPSWGLWLRQIRAIVGLELHKNFFSRRSILIYLIAWARRPLSYICRAASVVYALIRSR